MNTKDHKILHAIQNLITHSRFKAYKNADHSEIAELLDQADHLCNLVMAENIDYTRVERLLKSLLIEHPGLSNDTFSVCFTDCESKQQQLLDD